MVNRIKLIMPALSLVMLLAACSVNVNGGEYGTSVSEIRSGNEREATVKRTVKIGKFSKVSASAGIKVIFTQGAFTNAAHISATPSADKYITVKVDDGELEVYYNNHVENIQGPTIVRVQAPVIEEVELVSAASFVVEGDLNLKGNLEFELTSAGSVTVGDITASTLTIESTSASSFSAGNLNVRKLKVGQSSASNVMVGNVESSMMEVESSSTAGFMASGFSGDVLTAEASSAAKVMVKGIDARTVKAEAYSGAGITLEGKCGNATFDSGSGGSVRHGKLVTGGNNRKRGADGGQTPPRRL